MCGIVGYIVKNDKDHVSTREKFFIEGLVMDTLRGWDSTGIIHVHDEFNVGTMRNTQAGPAFVRNKKFLETETNGWACIGHNRAATHGSVKISNAHPFRYGDVAMVHNGTLRDKGHSLEHHPKKALDVDSAMIAYNLSMVAPEDAAKVIGKLRGSYALAWTDARDQSINFARNHDRPLHFGTSNSGDMLMFMSEAGMMRAISDRQRTHQAEVRDVIKLDALKHVKFKKGSLVPEVQRIVPFVQRSARGSTHSQRGTHGAQKQWKDTVRSLKNGRTSTDSGSESNVSPLARDGYGWKDGKQTPANKILMDAMSELYQLKPHMRVGFQPKEYIDWDGERGLVRGYFYHPEWGNTQWEGVVQGVAKSWASKERMNKLWSCSPIGLSKSWSKAGSMASVLLALRSFNFHWDEDENADLSEQEDESDKELFWGPDETLIFREHLEGLLAYGCSYCTCNLTADDHEDIEWVGDNCNQPLCLECQTLLTDPKFDLSEEKGALN